MSTTALLVIVLVCAAVTTIKLPGNCPKVKETQFFESWKNKHFFMLINTISFSPDTPSYLFRDNDKAKLPKYKLQVAADKSGVEVNYTILLEYWKVSHRTRFVSIDASRNGNGSVTLRGNVLDDLSLAPLQTCPPIVEVVHVWVEEEIGIIWSCVDLTGERRHDEAILIFDFNPTSFEPELDERERKARKTRLSLLKYVNETLLNHISFTDGHVEYRGGYIPSQCVNVSKENIVDKRLLPVGTIIIVIFFIVALGTLWHCSYVLVGNIVTLTIVHTG